MSGPPRVLEPQCAWTADDVADEATWTEHLDDHWSQRRTASRLRVVPDR